MKITIDVPYDKQPEKCEQCKFIRLESVNSGRHFTFVCRLTDIGDDICEYSNEKDRAEKMMREVCPMRSK